MSEHKKISYKEELKQLAKEKCEEAGFELKLKVFDFSKIDGGVDTNIGNIHRRLILNFRRMTFSPNNPKVFTKSLVTLFHELAHIEQFNVYKTGNTSDEMIFNYLANQNNRVFYNENYDSLEFETRAEWGAVREAHEYLWEHHRELNAFECIKGMIDEKIKYGDKRYIGYSFENCSSIEEVYRCFQRKCRDYDQQKTITIRKAESIYENEHIGEHNIDKYIRSNGIVAMFHEYGKENVKLMFNILKTATEQNKLMAAYILEKHEDFRKFIPNKEVETISVKDYVNALVEYKIIHSGLRFDTSHKEEYLNLVEQFREKRLGKEHSAYEVNENNEEIEEYEDFDNR